MGKTTSQANFIKTLFIGFVFIALMAGCAGNKHAASTGDYIDDSVITAKVKAEIFDDPMLKVFQISVESFKGIVQLSGFVDSAQASARAEKVAKSVNGVKSVKNDLLVK